MAVIALDFDGTVTSAPVLFKNFCILAQALKHDVYIVTMRYPSEECDLLRSFFPYLKGVLYTFRKAKKDYTKAIGLKIDIWIDDKPEAILQDAVQVYGYASVEGDVIFDKTKEPEPDIMIPVWFQNPKR